MGGAGALGTLSDKDFRYFDPWEKDQKRYKMAVSHVIIRPLSKGN